LDAAVIAVATDIVAVVADTNLDGWRLERARLGTDAFVLLASGETPVAGALASLGPGRLANGFYRLRLSATDMSGRSSSAEIVVEVSAAAKPAQYARAETDLTVTLGGVSLEVVRAYDSLERDRAQSFGFGWRLALRDFALETDLPPTGRETLGVFNPFRSGTRLQLTLPDGRRVGFTFTPEEHQLPGLTFFTPAFVADPGVGWTLHSADAKLTLAGNRFYDLGTGRPYNPASGEFAGPQYTLTAPHGTRYHARVGQGVEAILAPGGARLSVSDSG